MKTTRIRSRPPCTRCGMRMIVISPLKNSKEGYECLRCGHTETLRIDDANATREAAPAATPRAAKRPASVHAPGCDKDCIEQLGELSIAGLELPPVSP
jgi:tRNA(Ile2) C34 agmatinyltransferase TiaS